jgi:hypothetical protein
MTNLPEALQSIVNPQSYHCLVWYYTAHLHELCLRVYQPPFDEGEVFFLVFQGVSYFEGPMGSWESVDFRLGTKEEFDEVMQMGHINLPQDNEILAAHQEHSPLFVIDRPDLKVRIVARDVGKVTDYVDVIRTPLIPGAT